jgi:hypothetical protein
MLKAFDFCIPTRGTKVPSAPDWLHEIKYDGYRLRVERNGDRVRLITRNGYDWTGRYPWIVESARGRMMQRSTTRARKKNRATRSIFWALGTVHATLSPRKTSKTTG